MSNEPAPGTPVAAPAPAAAAPVAPVEKSMRACANCGAPMHGPYCYACGQPEKGMIRHLASVMADVADTVFNIDSRIFRSIFPLYFRPGYLTDEYFAGRRTRYVTPFRLFFFLCIISFFAIQATLNYDDFQFNLGDSGNAISHAQNTADLQKRTEHALKGIEAAQNTPAMPAEGKKGLDNAADKIREQSERRMNYLKARDEAKAKGVKPPPDPQGDGDDTISFDEIPWDAKTHPLQFDSLPLFANDKLNEVVGRVKENLAAARRDPRHLIASVFSVLPQTLFVLMPLFAVLLKIVYVFKRRLYMEHLMVALHSHAFIFMSLLLLAIVQLLLTPAATHAPYALPLLKLLRAAMWTWLPIYLFLMAKRVYRQGWTMTTLRFGFVGLCYVVMLSFGLASAIVIGLATA
jgi:hypothetical protein